MLIVQGISIYNLIKYKNSKKFEKDQANLFAVLNIVLVFVQVIILTTQVQLLSNQNMIQDQQKEF
jgi:heme/copper-type cytochrome/quinol oxidase subunit 2